jgi:hypothetical protein
VSDLPRHQSSPEPDTNMALSGLASKPLPLLLHPIGIPFTSLSSDSPSRIGILDPSIPAGGSSVNLPNDSWRLDRRPETWRRPSEIPPRPSRAEELAEHGERCAMYSALVNLEAWCERRRRERRSTRRLRLTLRHVDGLSWDGGSTR